MSINLFDFVDPNRNKIRTVMLVLIDHNNMRLIVIQNYYEILYVPIELL